LKAATDVGWHGIASPTIAAYLLPVYVSFSVGAQIGLIIADTVLDTDQPTNLRPVIQKISFSCRSTGSSVSVTTPQICWK
jgi:hypothetical protein